MEAIVKHILTEVDRSGHEYEELLVEDFTPPGFPIETSCPYAPYFWVELKTDLQSFWGLLCLSEEARGFFALRIPSVRWVQTGWDL